MMDYLAFKLEQSETLKEIIRNHLDTFGEKFREKLAEEFKISRKKNSNLLPENLSFHTVHQLTQQIIKLYNALRKRVVSNVFIVPLEQEYLQKNQLHIIEIINEKLLYNWFTTKYQQNMQLSDYEYKPQENGSKNKSNFFTDFDRQCPEISTTIPNNLSQSTAPNDMFDELFNTKEQKKQTEGKKQKNILSSYAYSYTTNLSVKDQAEEKRRQLQVMKRRKKYQRTPKPPINPFDFKIIAKQKKKIKKPHLWKNINTNILDLHESSKFIHSAKALFQLQSPLYQINNLVEKIIQSKEEDKIETKVIKQIIQPDFEFNTIQAILEKRIRATLKQKEGDESLRHQLYQGILSMREQLGEEEDINYSKSLFFMRAGNPQGFIYQTYLLLYSLKRGFTMKKLLEERMVCLEGFIRTISVLIQIEGPDAIQAIKQNARMSF